MPTFADTTFPRCMGILRVGSCAGSGELAWVTHQPSAAVTVTDFKTCCSALLCATQKHAHRLWHRRGSCREVFATSLIYEASRIARRECSVVRNKQDSQHARAARAPRLQIRREHYRVGANSFSNIPSLVFN